MKPRAGSPPLPPPSLAPSSPRCPRFLPPNPLVVAQHNYTDTSPPTESKLHKKHVLYDDACVMCYTDQYSYAHSPPPPGRLSVRTQNSLTVRSGLLLTLLRPVPVRRFTLRAGGGCGNRKGRPKAQKQNRNKNRNTRARHRSTRRRMRKKRRLRFAAGTQERSTSQQRSISQRQQHVSKLSRAGGGGMHRVSCRFCFSCSWVVKTFPRLARGVGSPSLQGTTSPSALPATTLLHLLPALATGKRKQNSSRVSCQNALNFRL